MDRSLFVAAGIAAVGMVLTLIFLPGRARMAAPDKVATAAAAASVGPSVSGPGEVVPTHSDRIE
jgi:hypothetical protein